MNRSPKTTDPAEGLPGPHSAQVVHPESMTVPVRKRSPDSGGVAWERAGEPGEGSAASSGSTVPAERSLSWELGSELFGYRLGRQLGTGAFARVFLAEQAGLAGRPVVLKISAIDGKEPQTLAQMQHTHIVPIYSLHEDHDLDVRVVCMPYLGGASLAQVLEVLHTGSAGPVSGDQLTTALETAEQAGPTTCTRFRTWSYVRCAVWIAARLAEGLQHAHERGVLHRDIKPSNILLASDGQPLLLDFHVAQWGTAESEVILGGTVAYAAPEHLEALLDPTPERVARVDRRSDIYSLGLVLFEMLGGEIPFTHGAGYSVQRRTVLMEMVRERGAGPPCVRQRRRDVPWSLVSILRKCLTPDPEARYQQAEHLAEDLRRFLDDRPLRHAPELSRIERVRKWLRRHPRLASAAPVAAVAGVLLLGAAGVVAAVQGHLSQARELLRTTLDSERKQSLETGTLRALCLVNTVTDLDDHLAQGARQCERTLALYGVLDRDDWQDRPEWQRLTEEERRRLGRHTRELLQLLAWARARSEPRNPARLREALALLDRAGAVRDLLPSPALHTDRAIYLEALGEKEAARRARAEAERCPPTGAQDHYLMATVHAREGGKAALARAIAELNEALRLEPRHYWALMERGICRQEQGDLTLAVADFSTCVGLWPDCAWGYFNRGYVLGRAGERRQAIEDFTAALAREPEFVPAHLNRGLVRLELKEYAPALADFDEAARLGRDDAFLHAGRGMALEALGRHGPAEEAFAMAFRRAEKVSASAQARLRWSYGFAVAARRPDAAQAAFDAVLRADPEQPQALYGRAMLAVEGGLLEEGLNFAGRAVEADPNWVEARRCRAIVLARLGKFHRAEQDINWCLEREPRSGVTLYAAACVAARMAVESPTSAARTQALEFLRRAFAEGYGRDRAATDPDLEGIRDGVLEVLREDSARR
jgi:serine/threonine protein kinase/tetratricopeptide (TPR) repeat protein